jgi:drug/metabolite transporter (DMT)-like permease
MRNLMWVGVLLVALGVLGLVVPSINFSETKRVIDLGPLQVNSTEQHNVPIPTIAAIVAVLAGVIAAAAGGVARTFIEHNGSKYTAGQGQNSHERLPRFLFDGPWYKKWVTEPSNYWISHRPAR